MRQHPVFPSQNGGDLAVAVRVRAVCFLKVWSASIRAFAPQRHESARKVPVHRSRIERGAVNVFCRRSPLYSPAQ